MERFLIIFVIVITYLLRNSEAATVYNVGDSTGWDISADFPSWVHNKTFYVGDTLVFQYSKYHTLNEVDKPSYDNCSTDNTLLTGNTGNTSVPLTSPGNRYFVCGVLTHCLGGMKLAVNIKGNGSSSPIGAPASAPASLGLNPLSPSSSGDGDGTFLPPFISGSSNYQFGKGTLLFSWFWTLFMVVVVRV
ncbi:hypothetical protein LUZ60_016843 [Juncus effusus]|nr:hypothetical protein LUZ60_016843 [Juncus effusus]